MLTRVRALIRNLFSRSSVDQELSEELRAYVDLLAHEKVQAGMDPALARRAALIEAGGMESVKETVRDLRAGAFLHSVWQDLRYAGRSLRRHPGFTAAAVATLALGIGANTLIFSLVYRFLLSPLPFPESERLSMIALRFSPQNAEYGTFSLADYLDLRARNRSFSQLALIRGVQPVLTGVAEPEEFAGFSVTSDFFGLLGMNPIRGRTFAAGEDGPSSPPLVVLSDAVWQRRFQRDEQVIGRTLRLDGKVSTIIGVMPPEMNFPPGAEIWTNLTQKPPTYRGPFFYRVIGRLGPGVSWEQAQAEMNAIGREVERLHPDSYTRLSLPIRPLREVLTGSRRPALLLLSGGVLMLLLIAVVNVANLLYARATSRERELAVRRSLGAGRARLIRQMVTESVLLALIGGAAAILLAEAGLRALRAWEPASVAQLEEVRLDGHILAFTTLLSIGTGLLFGLAPAWQSGCRDLASSMKEGGRGGTPSNRARRTRQVLVVTQVALSLMLLTSAGLLIRSLWLLRQVNAGPTADPRSVLSMHITPSAARFRQGDASVVFYRQLLERVRGLPGIEAASVGDSLPPDRLDDSDTFQIEGQELGAGQMNPSVPCPTVSPDYFRTLGVPIKRGRAFDERDRSDSRLVVVISESMARTYFAGKDPLGRRLKPSGPSVADQNPFLEIVGVAADVKFNGLQGSSELAYYRPVAQNPAWRMSLIVRSSGQAASMAPALRSEIRRLDQDALISRVQTMEEALGASLSSQQFSALLIGLFAATALALAVVGIYSVVAYAVTQRTGEIGVRIALGASAADVLRLILGIGVRMLVGGILLGLAGTYLMARLLQRFLFEVQPHDPLTIGVCVAGLAIAAVAANLIPAYRGIRISPVTALRAD